MKLRFAGRTRCIRDVLQARRAYKYTLLQAVKARLVKDWREYKDTRVFVDMDWAVNRALELNAYLAEVPYARYAKHLKKKRGHQR